MASTSTYQIWQPLLLSAMIAMGIIIGYKMNDRDDLPVVSTSMEPTVGTGRVEQAIRYIESRYVDEIDSDILVQTAIQAITNELDPHSIYITAQNMGPVDDVMSGSYHGIGIETVSIDDSLYVMLVDQEGPAHEAGLLAFDQITSVNDVVTTGLDLAEVRNMLRGRAGESIAISYKREGVSNQVEITLRDLPYRSVSASHMVDSLIAYIKVDHFSGTTYEEFMQALEVLIEEHKARHLIIDLRDNPGGLLPEATEILSQLFIQKGNLLVYTQDKNGRKNKYKTTGKPFFAVDEIAVLINENSASGSEIIAGAIQDWDRGVIVGRRSFGKGLVQDQYRLSDQSALRLTTARYYTPSGRSIQKPFGDLATYSDEVNSRYDSGELYSADSVVSDTSQRYETLRYRRPIYGGGGVSPDLFVPLDSTAATVRHLQVGRFAYEHYRKINDNLPSESAKYMANTALHNSLWTAYLQDIITSQTTVNPEKLQSFQDEITTLLAYEVGRMKYGNDDVDRLLTRDDPFVLEAVRFLRSDLQLTDL